MNHSIMESCIFDRNLYDHWRQRSSWSEHELSEYACAYSSFKQFQRSVDYFKWILYTCGGIVGITSSVLTLWTLASLEFKAVSFMYHRMINIFELPFMILMLERAVRDYSSPAFLNSRAWTTYFTLVSGKIDNAIPTSVNIVTLFICFERAVACLAPTYFPFMNRRCVVWIVVISSFIISVSLWTPSCFAHTIMYDNRTEPARYMPVWTTWGKGTGYRFYGTIKNVFTSLGTVLLIIASLSAVIGLRRTAKRNLRRHNNNSLAVMRNSRLEYLCLLRQLSYLQLCETVPLILLHVLLIAAESIHWDYRGGGAMAPQEITFDLAMQTLSLAKTKQHMVICLDISNVTAHCFHFYWYLLFCPKVRRGFVARFTPFTNPRQIDTKLINLQHIHEIPTRSRSNAKYSAVSSPVDMTNI